MPDAAYALLVRVSLATMLLVTAGPVTTGLVTTGLAVRAEDAPSCAATIRAVMADIAARAPEPVLTATARQEPS